MQGNEWMPHRAADLEECHGTAILLLQPCVAGGRVGGGWGITVGSPLVEVLANRACTGVRQAVCVGVQ